MVAARRPSSTRSAPTEGALNLIAWVGYVEDGTTEGYENYDWVTPFEEQTGCKVNVKYADSSDEMYNLMTQQAGHVGRRVGVG